MTATLYGIELPATDSTPMRSVVIQDQSPAGNLILRVGREHGSGWEQTEHVVMTPDEAEDFARRILTKLGRS